MAYDQKDLEGNLWAGNDAVVLGKGKITVNGEAQYCAIVKSLSQKGEEIYEVMVSAGKVYHNTPENKKNPLGPDFGGSKVYFNGIQYRFAGWSNVSQNGGDYINAKLQVNEESPF